MRWFFRIVIALALVIGGLAIWKKEQLLRLHAVNTLFSEEKIVSNFSNMRGAFQTAEIPVKGAPAPLPSGSEMALPADWQEWLQRRAVTAVVVVQDGAVVHEAYHLGTKADDQRISWSMAKSYLSALFGILKAQGEIDSLDDPVTKYAPSLKDSAYDGASIRNVLQMSTGVVFDEDYLDFWSDINKMGRILALGGSMDGFAAGLTETDQPAGDAWRYVSIDTHVLGMVLRGATGRSVSDLLGEHLLDPLGAHGSPHYVTDGYGVAFVLGGLNLTTRDYARMGELFRLNGQFQGKQIVPEDWAIESTTPSAKTEPGKWKYGYQWWMAQDAPEGEIIARGVYGQYIYINRATGTVIAVNAADRQFREDGANDDALQMFRRIAAQK
ncbi:serine hydrolase domain-containing protein [Thalassococcus lentus]|uniref:Serine hydrolase n=1 Tax=Thalassococcus lentus TaxID=1210524 RepID=A0ABT4XQ09_9RHOB|nr:serine hydrolase [Thalassococcus lentus]MDA7424041.1 serine hydrolase [Thalassococcus lentus]